MLDGGALAIGKLRDPRQSGEGRGCDAVRVVNRRDVKTAVLQPARHVRAHSTNSDESDIHVLKLATDAHG